MLGAGVDLALPIHTLAPAAGSEARVDHLLIGGIEGIERRGAVIHPQPPPAGLAQPRGEPPVPQRGQLRIGGTNRARVARRPVRGDAGRAAIGLGPFQEGVAAHQSAHRGAGDGGIIAPGAGAKAGVDPLLQRAGEPVEIGAADHRPAGHRRHRRARGTLGHVISRLRQILAVAVSPRGPDPDNDMRRDPARADGGQHRLVRRPDLVEIAVLQFEQVVPVVHVKHRIAGVRAIIARGQPDRQPLRRQPRRLDPGVFDQAATIPGPILRHRRCPGQPQQPCEQNQPASHHASSNCRIKASCAGKFSAQPAMKRSIRAMSASGRSASGGRSRAASGNWP